tara:strand:- start:209497 stop:210480 length:984 start_codon:yes stop_codon:yes gene_type:complete
VSRIEYFRQSEIDAVKIAVTGATGFLGRYVVKELRSRGHQIVAWRGRSAKKSDERESDAKESGTDGHTDSGTDPGVRWISGRLGEQASTHALVAGADAVVHAALYRDCANFMDDPRDLISYAETNVIGALRLLQSSAEHQVRKFVNVSSGTVHQKVLTDRPLDETHPLWPESMYGAAKASVETWIHAFGFGGKLNACTLRPTAIYGVAEPIESSKWFALVKDVAAAKTVHPTGGSKEVHVADVARAIRILLETDHPVAGETYNCSDRMISRFEVAQVAKRLSGSDSIIEGKPKVAKNAIETRKLQNLGMQFGGTQRLEETVAALLRV